jgi:hypothetical protein
MVNNTRHQRRFEAGYGLLAALTSGLTTLGLLAVGLRGVGFALGLIMGGGVAMWGALSSRAPRLSALLGWSFAFVVLTWPVIFSLAVYISLATSGGD